jgi:hypothetical protein
MIAPETVTMLRDDIAQLRSDFITLYGELAATRRDMAATEARYAALESWRDRFITQDDTINGKSLTKTDELFRELASFQAELSQFRGEQLSAHRVTVTLVGILAAAIGSAITHILNRF